MKVLIRIFLVAALVATISAIWFPTHWIQLGLTAAILIIAAAGIAGAVQNGAKK
jgi:hypothetical protein